jgi:hypothetical protein
MQPLILTVIPAAVGIAVAQDYLCHLLRNMKLLNNLGESKLVETALIALFFSAIIYNRYDYIVLHIKSNY